MGIVQKDRRGFDKNTIDKLNVLGDDRFTPIAADKSRTDQKRVCAGRISHRFFTNCKKLNGADGSRTRVRPGY